MPILKSETSAYLADAERSTRQDGRGGAHSLPPLSEYEKQRKKTIQRNQEMLAALGLEQTLVSTPQTVQKNVRMRKARVLDQTGLRQSSRVRVIAAPEVGQAPAESEGVYVTHRLLVDDAARAARSSTCFARKVLQIVNSIPRGKVVSYGQVAALAGRPNNARQVGKLLALGLSAPGTVPWQRVINAAGGISLPPEAGGELQHQLLTAEGVTFGASRRVLPGTFWEPDPVDSHWLIPETNEEDDESREQGGNVDVETLRGGSSRNVRRRHGDRAQAK
jgi:methylated-DNA-protein-cysteine methyltransferase-like protein